MTEIKKYDDPFKAAELMFASGLFPGARNGAGVYTIVEYGRELGIPAVAALQNICIIKGKMCTSGQVLLGIALKNGIKVKFVQETVTGCIIDFSRGDAEYQASFLEEDAQRVVINADGLKLNEKDNWKNYPKEMYKWRAVSKGMRVIAPDLIAGLYLTEEMDSILDKPKDDTTETAETAETTAPETTGTAKPDTTDVEDFLTDSPPDTTFNDSETEQEDERTSYDDPTPDTTLDTTPDPTPDTIDPTPDSESSPRISNAEAAVRMLGNARKGPKLTDPQMKRIHALLSESGFAPFYGFFKMYLFKIGYINNPKSFKAATTVLLAKKIMDEFNMHVRNIFSIPQFHIPMKNQYKTLTKKTQVKLLLGLAGFIREIGSMPNKINEDLTEQQLNDYFSLFLTTIVHQNDPGVTKMHTMFTTCKNLIKEDAANKQTDFV